MYVDSDYSFVTFDCVRRCARWTPPPPLGVSVDRVITPLSLQPGISTKSVMLNALLLPPLLACVNLAYVGTQAQAQDDTRYPYPTSKKVYRHDELDRRYGVTEGPPSPPVRLEDLYLDKYLQTQDPKYFDPSRYPGQPARGPSFLGQRPSDGTPDGVRTDFIPNSHIVYLLEQANDELSQVCTEDVFAHWAFETDISEETQLRAVSRYHFNKLAYNFLLIRLIIGMEGIK